MLAGLNVITDNLDYLLWGRAAVGEPGGVLLSLLMALGAAALALPGGIALACLAWRFTGLVRKALFVWAELIRGIPLIFVIFWMWYLLPLITGGDEVFELAQDLGALAVYISGAGPTIMAVVHKDDTEFFDRAEAALAADGPLHHFTVHRLLADNVGAVVS